MIMRGINVALLLCLVSTLAVAEFNPEIVGGTPADYENYPFYAISLLVLGTSRLLCGATVIYEDILLTTAGGCAREGLWSEGTTVVVNPSGGLVDETRNETHQVDRAFVHPGFDDRTNINSIMLVKLTTPTEVTPVALNTQASIPAMGETLTAIGFGLTANIGRFSPDLLEVDIEARPARDCRFWGNRAEQFICSGEVGAGVCNGDYGSPLLTQSNAQVGIAAFARRPRFDEGLGCGDRFPDGFTRVSAYSQWIQDGICCLASNPPSNCEQVDCDGYFNDSGCPCGRFRFLCRLSNRCLF